MTRVGWILAILLCLGVWSTERALAATVTMAWHAPSQGVPLGYSVYRQKGTGAFELRDSTDASVLTYADTNVVPGRYCWHVTAWNAMMESAPSNQACATIRKPRKR